MASSVWTQATQVYRLLAPWDPRGRSLQPRPPSVAHSPRHFLLRTGPASWEVGRKLWPGQGWRAGWGLWKLSAGGGLQRYRGEDLKDGGAIKGKGRRLEDQGGQ